VELPVRPATGVSAGCAASACGGGAGVSETAPEIMAPVSAPAPLTQSPSPTSGRAPCASSKRGTSTMAPGGGGAPEPLPFPTCGSFLSEAIDASRDRAWASLPMIQPTRTAVVFFPPLATCALTEVTSSVAPQVRTLWVVRLGWLIAVDFGVFNFCERHERHGVRVIC